MMRESQGLRRDLKKSREKLRTLYDEVKVRAHLAGMDAEERWRMLSGEAEKLSKELGQVSRRAIEEMVEQLKAFRASFRH